MKKAFIFSLAVAVSALSIGQVPPSEPPAELKKLDYMVGDWTSAGSFTIMGMESEMTMDIKVKWDGQFLRQETVNEVSGERMTETMFLGWDAKKSQYFSHSYTSLSAMPRVEHGKLDGEKLVMVSEPWDVMGMDMESRTMIWKTGDNAMMSMEFKMDGDWVKAGEWTLKRKK